MALSNWATYAIEFDIIATTISPDSPSASLEAKELDDKISQMALEAFNEDKQESLFKDDVFSKLVEESHQSRTSYVVSSKESDGEFFDEQTDWLVRLYKNWIYVGSETRHQGNSPGVTNEVKESFTNGTLMQIQEGEISFGGFDVFSQRGPQDGIYAVCLKYTYEQGEVPHKRIQGMLGCGVYGYSDEGDYVGVKPESFAHLKDFAIDNEYALKHVFSSEAAAFNQGDQFFSQEYGVETPKTIPGAKHSPMIEDLLDGLEDRFKDK